MDLSLVVCVWELCWEFKGVCDQGTSQLLRKAEAAEGDNHKAGKGNTRLLEWHAIPAQEAIKGKQADKW